MQERNKRTLERIRSIFETDADNPLYKMLAVFANAPSMAPEMWSSIRNESYFHQGYDIGGFDVLHRTAEMGGFENGTPVGVFDAETNKPVHIVPSQKEVVLDPKVTEIIGELPPKIANLAPNQYGPISTALNKAPEGKLMTPSGKHYLSLLSNTVNRNINVTGPYDQQPSHFNQFQKPQKPTTNAITGPSTSTSTTSNVQIQEIDNILNDSVGTRSPIAQPVVTSPPSTTSIRRRSLSTGSPTAPHSIASDPTARRIAKRTGKKKLQFP